MKPVNRILADEFHRDTNDGIDAVFQRMFQVAGNKFGMSHAEVFDVSQNTIKTWRRRGAVSTKFLQGFAKEYGTSLDYLLYGTHGAPVREIVLDANEAVLIEHYRTAPKPLRDAALRVLLSGDQASQPKIKKQVNVSATGGQAAGRNIVNKGRKS